MKASDNLFELIKSLDSSERRYFNLSTLKYKGKKENVYLKLFKAIDKQTVYDEEKLKKKNKGAAFLKNLSAQKNYLYALILTSLNSHHSNTDKELNDHVHHIEILYSKGLYKQCQSILKKARKLALRYENHLQLSKLSRWETLLMASRSYKGETEKTLKTSFEDIFKNLDLYKNTHNFHYILAQIYLHVYQSGFSMRDESEVEKFKKLTDLFLNKPETIAQSYHAKYLYYLSHLTYYFKKKDYANALKFAEKRVKLMEEHPHQIAENPYLYSISLQNLIICQSNLKKYDDSLVSIKKLRAIRLKPGRTWNITFYFANNEELMLYIATGEFEKGVLLIENTINKTKTDFKIITKHLQTIFNYSCAYTYLGAKNYSACIKYLNKILNSDLTDIRSDLYCFAKIMNLIAHYEMEHSDLLEYTVRSTYRYLYKRNKLYKFETILLNFIRKKLPKIHSRKELVGAYHELKKDIETLTKDPHELEALRYFDFISWIESRIQDRPFAEVIKEKQKENRRKLNT